MANEITISTNDSDLRSMLIKLMGRGTSMSQSHTGQYELKLTELIDLVSKIAQRVALQNHCKMSDFHGQFEFQDGARESVPSFDSLSAYRTLNSSPCVKVLFSFAFLIDFLGRGIEKQSVTIEITNSGVEDKLGILNLFLRDLKFKDVRFGKLNISIEYTDITWANDIKNLFEQYVNVHLQKYKMREMIAKFLDVKLVMLIAFPLSALIVAAMFSSTKESTMALIGGRLDEISALQVIDRIEQKLDIILFGENKDVSAKVMLIPMATMLVVGGMLWTVLSVVKNIPYSVIILSDEAKKVYDRIEGRRSIFNFLAIGGVIVSIVASVLASNIDRWITSQF